MKPVEFVIQETDEALVTHTGLAAIGALLGQTGLARRTDALSVEGKPRPQTKHSDVLLSMVGLLCLGKSDFTDIAAFREDPFFPRSLGLKPVPSETTLRQRMSELGGMPQPLLRE